MKALALALVLGSPDPARLRLADAFARELLRATGGEGATIDVSGGGVEASAFRSRVLLDLVQGGAKPSSLRARGVLSEGGGRLVASFRIEGHDGRVRDVVSVSTADGTRERPASLPLTPARNALRVLGSSWSPIEGPILALAALGEDRLAALTPDAVLLLRLNPLPTLEVREALQAPLQTIRAPGGFLVSGEKDSVWVFTNRTGRADLLSVDGHRASWGAQATLPPGFPTGLAYRPGTSLIESASTGALLLFVPGEIPYAIDASGGLLKFLPEGPETTGLRLGPTLARLDRLLVGSDPAPPGSEDRLVFLDSKDLSVCDTIAVPGTVRAIAARPGADQIVVALETSEGFQILQLRVAR
jgi:hypothetical protein